VIMTAEPCGAHTAAKYSQRPIPANGEKCRAKRVIQAVQLIEYAMRKNVRVRKSIERVLRTTPATSLPKASMSEQQRAQGDYQLPL
jgi:hypothetical protein